MTGAVIGMGIIGVVIIIASFLVANRHSGQEDHVNVDLVKVNDSYEFSDQEREILKQKIEDEISEQAKNILYETNQSLESMSSEKIMIFGNYASVALQEIEKKQEELTAQYNLLDIKYKEIIKSAKLLEEVQRGAKHIRSFSDDTQEETAAGEVSGKDNKEEQTDEKQTDLKTEKKKKNPGNKKEKADRKDVSKEEPKENVPDGKEIKITGEKSEQKEEKATDQTKEKTDRKESVAEAATQEQKTDGEEQKTDGENPKTDVENQKTDGEDPKTDVENRKTAGKDQPKKENEKKADAEPKKEKDTSEKKDDVNGRIKEMYKEGSSIADIAKQLGLSVGEVKRTVNTFHRRKK